MGNQFALKVENVFKRYGSTAALTDLSFEVVLGEVHALLGENGAGKSTLIKILSGVVQPDSGEFSTAAGPHRFRSPRDARAVGIATAFQELTLVPQLTVAQNLMLGQEPSNSLRLATNRALAEASYELLAEWELDGLDVELPVEGLPLGVQQQIELVRALGQGAGVLLLDEPTAALGAAQVEWLFRQVVRVKEAGTTVVFISHRMQEVREICDRVTVLRGGTSAGTFGAGGENDATVLQMMLGRDLEKAMRRKQGGIVGEAVLTLDRLTGTSGFHDVSLSLRSGEVVGLAALQGHGQSDLFMTLFGARRAASGRIIIGERDVKFRSPRAAIDSGLGISLVPEDRKTEGVILSLSGVRNVTLPNIGRLSRFGFMRRKAERAEAREIFEAVNVRLSAIDSDVSLLSGGNQQKLAIGKWLRTSSQCSLMYDPNRGVDVGTKEEIFNLMNLQAASGAALFFYSTDLEELLAVSHRIFVMYRGRIVAELSEDEMTREKILVAMLGQTETQMEAS